MDDYYLICEGDRITKSDVAKFLGSLESRNLIPGTLSTGRPYVQVNYFKHDSLASDDLDVIADELTKTIRQAYEEQNEKLKKKVLEWKITLKKASVSMDEDRLVWP